MTEKATAQRGWRVLRGMNRLGLVLGLITAGLAGLLGIDSRGPIRQLPFNASEAEFAAWAALPRTPSFLSIGLYALVSGLVVWLVCVGFGWALQGFQRSSDH